MRPMSQADVNRAVSEAIAYRDGKGVEKDLDKAIALLRPLSEESEWASRELLTTLFMKNDRKDDVERMKLAERMSEAGDMNATIRLATCYRDGRGSRRTLTGRSSIFPDAPSPPGASRSF